MPFHINGARNIRARALVNAPMESPRLPRTRQPKQAQAPGLSYGVIDIASEAAIKGGRVTDHGPEDRAR